VIGGGPGGLAAAQIACERGHQVTLMEKQSELGGAFRWASTVFPHNQVFLDYLTHQVESLPIEIKLGQEATDVSIKEISPDAIIVATGGNFDVPQIPGGDLPHVFSGSAIQDFIQDVRGVEEGSTLSIEGPVAIVGANLIGLELAEFIARRGKDVRLLEPSRRFAVPAGKKRRGDHAKRLDLLGVSVNTGVAIEAITTEGVKIRIDDGSEHLVKAKSVFVIGTPLEESHFLESVQGAAAEVYGIGDCTGFGLSKKAVNEAMSTIYKL
jgi:2,4-dienoyl-CoA reductase (NADPH2)